MRARLAAIWVIAYREILVRGRSKAFRISTGLLLVALVVGIVLPTALSKGSRRYTVAVAASSAQERTDLMAAIAGQARSAGITVASHPAPSRAAAVARVDSGAASAAVVGTGELVWKGTQDSRLAPVLTAASAQAEIGQRARALGLTSGQLAGLLGQVRPTVTTLHAQPNREPQTVVALIGIILLFVALNFYGAYVLTGVVEEKSSRIVEVLLARTRPADLLVGKVTGIGLLGLGQFAALAAVAAAVLLIVHPANVPAGTVPLIGSVVLWFVLGYCFYSLMYGSLGALASRTEDAQAAVAPVTVCMLLIYLGALATLSNPRQWWVTAGSLFPPTAPVFMPLRAALTDVPAWQIGASVVLMAAAIVALASIGGRVYKGAVLHTGGRLKLRQAWHRA